MDALRRICEHLIETALGLTAISGGAIHWTGIVWSWEAASAWLLALIGG